MTIKTIQIQSTETSIRLYAIGTAIALLALSSARAETVWPKAPPEQHGFSKARLDALTADLAGRNTRSLLIARHGLIVHEWYAADSSASRRFGSASLAKALVGGMSLLVAIQDGRIRPDDLASKYIPAWKNDPRKKRIAIRHLATHSAGIENAEQDNIPHMQLPGWKGEFWRRDPDPFSVAIHKAPAIFEPGARYDYSNPGMAALAYAVTKAAGQDVKSLLAARVFQPLDVPETDWDIGYRRGYEVDGLKLYANWGGGEFTARAIARVGQLILQNGRWGERQLFDAGLVQKSVSYAGTPVPDRSKEPAPASGLCWYTNFDGAWPAVPRDAIAGAGAGHQLLLVVPSLALVVVRQGGALDPQAARDNFWGLAAERVFNPAVAAIDKKPVPPPYPPSAVIRGVVFAPETEIVRRAIDSDNWPITWGADGDLYTAYGDGYGFDPRVDSKLSLGFARIAGPPGKFTGINIRSESGEREGDGRRGLKASGMLSIGGVLYMWVRNAGNAQLAASADGARSWEWLFRFEESFGSPAFLNFGRDYAGARDGYVYVYSQDGPSAYESDDGIVLARAPRDRIPNREAWEVFTGLTGGQPKWSRDIRDRRRVSSYPGRCQRVDAVYNEGLGRYLLAVGYDHAGGWGLYDAPQPWGPWTTAFHTDYWGLGGTHGYRLPSKWISGDGRTMQLVFSGVRLADATYDAFCVRRVSLSLR